jgi:hypothetical protein
MEDVMDVIFTTYKGRHLDTVEIYRIYKKTEQGVQNNDEKNITKNEIFDVLSTTCLPIVGIVTSTSSRNLEINFQ